MTNSSGLFDKIFGKVFLNSIKNRIIFSFAFTLSVTIIIGEIFVLFFVKDYYYSGVEKILTQRVTVASEFLNKYGEYSDIEGKSDFLFNTFLGESDKKFLVQTINKDGVVVMDSFGQTATNVVKTKDVELALGNQLATGINIDVNTKEKTMSASKPLMRYSNVEGVVRYTVSMSNIDNAIRDYYATSLSFVFLFVFLLVIISAVLSQSIVYPIKRLIVVAREMAKGNFDARADVLYDDEIGELSNTLNYMAQEISKSESMKRDFISSISHELRTPLTSIKGWGETLLADDIEKGSSLEIGLQIISSEADRLQGMVEELLDFSRLETRKMKIEKTEVSLRKIIDSVFNQMQPKAKGIDFSHNFFGHDTKILGDENRLRQVFINVIANSIKFSKENAEIRISLTGYENKVLFVIEDNGIGIAEENLARVKEKFFKENINSSGSGIGLALVDEIVKLHNGVMNIESKQGEWTKISIEFPSVL